jgi:hypothetical protein
MFHESCCCTKKKISKLRFDHSEHDSFMPDSSIQTRVATNDTEPQRRGTIFRTTTSLAVLRLLFGTRKLLVIK